MEVNTEIRPGCGPEEGSTGCTKTSKPGRIVISCLPEQKEAIKNMAKERRMPINQLILDMVLRSNNLRS